MAGTKETDAPFEFSPEPEDTVRLHLDTKELKLEDTLKQQRLDTGFDPYNTGVFRAQEFASKLRKKRQ